MSRILNTFNPTTAATNLARAYTWGDVIPTDAVDEALGYAAPDDDMRHGDAEEVELIRLDRIVRLREALLGEHKMLAIYERGTLRLVRPADQIQVARDRRFAEIDKQLRALTLEIAHLEITGLSNAEISAQHDAAAQTDGLRRALNPRARRIKHQLPDPAIPTVIPLNARRTS